MLLPVAMGDGGIKVNEAILILGVLARLVHRGFISACDGFWLVCFIELVDKFRCTSFQQSVCGSCTVESRRSKRFRAPPARFAGRFCFHRVFVSILEHRGGKLNVPFVDTA